MKRRQYYAFLEHWYKEVSTTIRRKRYDTHHWATTTIRIRNYYWLVRNSILYILYTPKDSAVIRPRFGEYVSIIFSHWVWMVFRIPQYHNVYPKGKSYYTFTSNYTRNLDFRLLDLMKSRSYTLTCGWPYTLAKLHAREETYIIHVCIYLYQFKSCQSVCYFTLKSSSIRVMSLPS